MKLILSIFFFGLFLILSTTFVQANHSWGGYHWARTSNPFTLKLGDNLSSSWKPFLATTSSDWSVSSVMDTTIVPGLTTPSRCKPTNGRIEVCNYRYGKNGWLGIAQVWISGSHITQATTKLNDSYFSTVQYNTPAWKNLVMCQEVGHTFGLDHQDEVFNNPNLGTCMDYTDDPSGLVKIQLSNEHPNAHDYQELETIYGHLDAITTIQNSIQKLPFSPSSAKEEFEGDFDNKSEWGKEIKNNKKVAVYERNFKSGHKLVTFIILASE